MRVAAASGIVPVLKQVAVAACVRLVVTTIDGNGGAALLRSGRVDAWIPDGREHALAAGAAAVNGATTIATSPVVLAAAPVVAAKLNSGGAISWGLVLDRSKVKPLTMEIQSPTGSGTSLALAGQLTRAVTQVTGDKYLALAATSAALRTVTPLTPAAQDEPISAVRLRVVEQRLLTSPSGARLGTAVHTSDGLPVLDYLWMEPTTPTGSTAAAALAMKNALLGPIGNAARTAHGFDSPDQVSFPDGPAASAGLSQLDPAEIRDSYALTGNGLRAGNTLAVVDVSGSMADSLGKGQGSRIDAVKASGQMMLGVLSPQSKLELWEFASQLEPPADHRQMIKLTPVDGHLAAFGSAIAELRSRRSGTALYATVLDAFRTMRADYNPKATNVIAVFTDGHDEDNISGLDLAHLGDELRQMSDPAKPIQLLFFGYGKADISAMTKIVAANNGLGGVWAIRTPQDIIGSLLEATGQSAHLG